VTANTHRLSLLLLVAWAVALPADAGPAGGVPRYDRTLLGQLVDQRTGAGVSGETVTLRWIPAEADAAYPAPWVPEWPRAAHPTVATGVTDHEGKFGFEALLPGSYALHLATAIRADPVFVRLPADGPAVHAEVEIDLGRHVIGRVVTATGVAVPRADVFVAHVEDHGGASRPRSLRTTDLDGRFLLPGLPAGTLWVEAYHPDHGFSPPARLAPEEDADRASVELQLREEAGRLWPLDRTPFAGLGVSLRMTGEGPEIVSVRPDGAAARGGLRPGDRIVEIGGLDARRMPLAEVLMRCRGAAGTKLRLTLARGDAPEEVVLTRAALE